MLLFRRLLSKRVWPSYKNNEDPYTKIRNKLLKETHLSLVVCKQSLHLISSVDILFQAFRLLGRCTEMWAEKNREGLRYGWPSPSLPPYFFRSLIWYRNPPHDRLEQAWAQSETSRECTKRAPAQLVFWESLVRVCVVLKRTVEDFLRRARHLNWFTLPMTLRISL